MPKWIKIIFIFGGLFFLAVISINYFGGQQLKKLKDAIPSEKLSQLQSLLPEQTPNTEEIRAAYKDFTSPDGRLKMQHPSSWVEIKDEAILEKTASQEWTKKYNLKTLIWAREPVVSNAVQLVVSSGSSDKEKTIEEIIEDMKESNLQQGWDMDIIKSEIGEMEGTFEALYQNKNNQNVYSKEKILILQKDENEKIIYLIALLSPDNPAENLELNKEWSFIIDSAQLTQ